MRVEASGLSDVGRERSGNEDFMVLEPDLGFFAVCDGMGGHAAGEVASQTAGEFLRGYVESHGAQIEEGHGERVLREAVEGANRAVHDLASSGQGGHGMGTTCVAVLVTENIAAVAHVGDSRLYLLRDGKVCQLTEDHTHGNEAIRNGIMTPEQAKMSPYSERVTRAVGVGPSVAVDTLRFEVVSGDTLLLCSDGLYRYDGGGVDFGRELGHEDVAGMPSRLISAANAAGGSDNLSAIVVRTHAETQAAMTRKTVVSEELKALTHVMLFQFLSMRERVTAMSSFKSVTFGAGERIMEEGDPSDSLFVVVEGKVDVSRGGARLATLGAGHHFGEMALLSQRPRTATVVAIENVRLLELPRTEFMSLVARDPGMGAKFLWQVAQMLCERLEDVYLLLPDPSRDTMQLSSLSPFGH